MSIESLWKTLRLFWIDAYLGPPAMIFYDAGKNFMTESFATNADLLHIRTKSVPLKSSNFMTIVERYLQPIRRAFSVIRKESAGLDEEFALQMVVKSINDSVGPNGLVPTLLIYGALPRLGLPHDANKPSIFARAVSLCKATLKMTKFFSRRQVRDAIHTPNSPDLTTAHSMHIGSHALVYRPKKDSWKGPFSVPEINQKGIILLSPPPTRPMKFRSTIVKKFINESPSSESGDFSHSRNLVSEELYQTRSPAPTSRDFQTQEDHLTPTSNECFVSVHISCVLIQQLTDTGSLEILATDLRSPRIKDDSDHTIASFKEFNSLIERGVFKILPEEESSGHQVYGARFIDTIIKEWKCNSFEEQSNCCTRI